MIATVSHVLDKRTEIATVSALSDDWRSICFPFDTGHESYLRERYESFEGAPALEHAFPASLFSPLPPLTGGSVTLKSFPRPPIPRRMSRSAVGERAHNNGPRCRAFFPDESPSELAARGAGKSARQRRNTRLFLSCALRAPRLKGKISPLFYARLKPSENNGSKGFLFHCDAAPNFPA